MSHSDTTPYELNTVTLPSLVLENGETLRNVRLPYERTGNQSGPVILVCHALTGTHIVKGTSEDKGWWDGLIGAGSYIDTNRYNVIAFNVLGGCEGATGPASEDPVTGRRYGSHFPTITIRDMVNAQYLALRELAITKVEAVVGGSLGGMQALEWGILHPRFMKKIFALAVTPALNDYGLAFNHIGITAIEQDPDFNGGDYPPGTRLKGLEVARMVGMVTYRTSELFDDRFQRQEKEGVYNVESYLDYQGVKLGRRFDPNSYLTLLKAMNSHDLQRGRDHDPADSFYPELIAISYEGDLVYPSASMEAFAGSVPKGRHYFIPTKFGHDGFLVEFEKWGGLLSSHLEENKPLVSRVK